MRTVVDGERAHEVLRRGGPDALGDKVAEFGRGASAASVEEAASLDYVLLAVPWRNVESALKSLPAWNGNEGPVKNGGRRVIFVSGDHPEPTAFIKQLIESFGFTAVDLGGLATGGRLQQAGGPLAGRDLVEFGDH
ncbi:MAG: hypothetical protein DMD87_30245 [Candidatus Rokuibacteriota bacterium]|nr:MAG: hypothetical protein DMD87_30245 [Candidatus Rokubacteria bacterium]